MEHTTWLTGTLVYLAASAEVAGVSGGYFHECKQVEPTPEAQNDADAKRLARAARPPAARIRAADSPAQPVRLNGRDRLEWWGADLPLTE